MGQGKKEKPPVVTVNAEKGTWCLHGDVQTVLERAVSDAIPPFRDDKANDSLAVRNAQVSLPARLHGIRCHYGLDQGMIQDSLKVVPSGRSGGLEVW